MNINKDTVAICMATYNGEQFLREQLNSIIRQTYQNFVLFIRDDNSTDNTVQIIKECIKKNSDKIVFIENDGMVCKSSKKNFAAILKFVSSKYNFNYFMFSDQDDYWIKNKVDISIKAMKKHEQIQMKPYLLHTDLCVVDKDLNTIDDSFFKYRSLNPLVNDLKHLLVQNNITGCTMLWNKDFNEIIDLTNDAVAMHDWWMAIVASLKGEIICLDKPTIKYRQHGNNVVGATKVNSIFFILKRAKDISHVKKTIKKSFEQAKGIYSVYNKNLNNEQRIILKEFISIENKNKLGRILKVVKGGYLKQGVVQIVGELLFI